MKDMVIKGTGNSRYLKSVSNFLALYPTYEDFVEALVAGTLPVDFNGLNTAGINQQGTALSTNNLLKTTTADTMDLPETATPDDMFLALANETQAARSIATGGTGATSRITAFDSLTRFDAGTGTINMNNLTDPGYAFVSGTLQNGPGNTTNGWVVVLRSGVNADGYVLQVFFRMGSESGATSSFLYKRVRGASGNWSEWYSYALR